MVQALIMNAVTGFAEPMTVVSQNQMQLFNEFSVLIFSYHLLPLTDFMTDRDTRNIVGKSLMAITLLNLGINMLISVS
jgi:hypothetical protein